MRVTGDDDRRPVPADLFVYRPLDTRAYDAVAGDVIPEMKAAGGRWFRVTAISPEQPRPPYPDGWYFEGWLTPPHAMSTPSKEGPFAFPIGEVTP